MSNITTMDWESGWQVIESKILIADTCCAIRRFSYLSLLVESKEDLAIYFHPQQQFRKGNVLTPVCQSFCSQGVAVADSLPRQTPP